MPDCPSLQLANESRRRAWRELQRLRKVLAAAGVPIDPIKRPADFAAEGAAICAAVAWLLLDRADHLQIAGSCFHSVIGTETSDPNPHHDAAKMVMHQILRTKSLGAALTEELRKLCRFQPRDLEKITRDTVGKVPAQLERYKARPAS